MNKLEKAKNAIEEMFSDTTVSIEETKSNLKELLDELEIMLEALSDE